MVIANVTKGSAIVAADFDGVDNTESSDLVRLAAVQTLTNKSIDADSNTISNLETDNFKAGVIDTDGTLSGNSDTKLATQKATKTYVEGKTTGRTKKYVGAITDVVVSVYETISTTRYSVEVDINVNAAGDVTWTSATAITGQIVIVG